MRARRAALLYVSMRLHVEEKKYHHEPSDVQEPSNRLVWPPWAVPEVGFAAPVINNKAAHDSAYGNGVALGSPDIVDLEDLLEMFRNGHHIARTKENRGSSQSPAQR